MVARTTKSPTSERTQDASASSAVEASASSASVQLKGKSLADQEAALAPEGPVQMKGGGGEADVHAAAAKGTEGSGGSLPHFDQIQSAFGKHDVSKTLPSTISG